MNCEKPDRHEPRMKCGYPLPCPWHTVVIDISSDPTRVIIPVTPGTKIGKPERIKELAGILSSSIKKQPKKKNRKRK